MKKISVLVFGVISLGLFSMSACSNSCEKDSKQGEAVEVKKDVAINAETSFEVSGMMCSMGCAAVIQKELNNLNGVAIAEVSFENESAVVKYDSRLVDEADLIAAIENVGDEMYTAKVVSTTSNLDAEVEEVSDVLDVVKTVVTH